MLYVCMLYAGVACDYKCCVCGLCVVFAHVLCTHVCEWGVVLCVACVLNMCVVLHAWVVCVVDMCVWSVWYMW